MSNCASDVSPADDRDATAKLRALKHHPETAFCLWEFGGTMPLDRIAACLVVIHQSSVKPLTAREPDSGLNIANAMIPE